MKNDSLFPLYYGLLVGAVMCALVTASLTWYSFVFIKLYTWHVLPMFPALPTFTLGQAAGFSVFTSLVVNQYVPISQEDNREALKALGYQFLNPAMLLLLGWILA